MAAIAALALFAVTTRTGMPMRVGDAQLDPDVPTVFEGDVPPEVRFQEVNLRIEPLSGLDALSGKPYRNPIGETVGAGEDEKEGASTVPASEHRQALTERDELRTDVEKLKAEVATAAEGQKTEVEKLKGVLATADQALAEAQSTHKAAIDDLNAKREDERKAATEKAKADHDALALKHKGEIDKLKEGHKAELEAAKKPK